jgi:competence protein ComEC
MKHYTRFRAYQLGECGASFSFSVNEHFTLIEARYNDYNKPHILWEMKNCGISRIDVLHITSWDGDHCQACELKNILLELQPKQIEYPAYVHDTDNAREALKLINAYSAGHKIAITPQIVQNCPKNSLCGADVLYNSLYKYIGSSNDKSIVKLFRRGSFTVLSLGDCESSDIRDRLIKEEILQKEVDVLILAHHGADNGFTTNEFLRTINPKVAVCASDYGNKYGHPDQVILNRLRDCGISYFSTKTGDVIAQTIDRYNFRVSNYGADNRELINSKIFKNKTYFVNEDE